MYRAVNGGHEDGAQCTSQISGAKGTCPVSSLTIHVCVHRVSDDIRFCLSWSVCQFTQVQFILCAAEAVIQTSHVNFARSSLVPFIEEKKHIFAITHHLAQYYNYYISSVYRSVRSNIRIYSNYV